MTHRRHPRSASRYVAAVLVGALIAAGMVVVASSGTPATAEPAAVAPIVIGHRGACGYVPEHTLESYALAHGMGADYVEPDLVRTRDGAFICLHDVYLELTTDVATVFPDRARADGRWYAADFTLEEVRRLRAVERLESRFPRDAGSRFAVPTFDEMVELVAGLNRGTGRRVGIYPELKAPAWHREQGLPMEQAFLESVRRNGLGGPGAPPVFVQCFEPGTLRELRRLGSDLPQVLLVGDEGEERADLSDAGLAAVAAFAQGIGPSKKLIEADPTLVERAHRHRLLVHPWTFRADDLPAGYPTFEDELAAFYGKLGVDGLFTDFPDRARRWLDLHPGLAAR